MSEPNLRVAIISANWGVKAHLPAWRAVEGTEVVAICTAHEATAVAAAAAHGIPKPYWDFRELARDPEIDLIDCGTRPDLREEMVTCALSAGKHVYNGIPFARDFAGARRLRDLARSSGKVAAVDAFAQWVPAHLHMKQMIEQGDIGIPHTLDAAFNLSLFNEPSGDFAWKWFADPAFGATALRNLGSHALHMMIHLYGPIEEAIGWQEMLLDEWRFDNGDVIRPDVPDTARAMLRFRNGAVGQLSVGWCAQAGEGWRVRANGSRGALTASHNHFPTARDTTLHFGRSTAASWMGHEVEAPLVIPEDLQQADGIKFTARDAPSQSYPMALAFQDIARGVRDGVGASPDFEQAWHVEQVIEAIVRSGWSRRWEPCPQ